MRWEKEQNACKSIISGHRRMRVAAVFYHASSILFLLLGAIVIFVSRFKYKI
jgi:hypothetical protein